MNFVKTLFHKKAFAVSGLDLAPPIGEEDLRDLFDHLDRPNLTPCSHTHIETIGFLQSRNLPICETVEWLDRNGGCCDCEVIFNVTEDWRERIGWEPKI